MCGNLLVKLLGKEREEGDQGAGLSKRAELSAAFSLYFKFFCRARSHLPF